MNAEAPNDPAAWGIGVTVARLRPNRKLGLALAETFGILAAVVVVTVCCGLWLPASPA